MTEKLHSLVTLHDSATRIGALSEPPDALADALADALTQRQRTIVWRVAETGFVTIEALAAEFGVSAQTVRRDIIALAEAGRLQRFHGGAGPVAGGGTDTELARPDYGLKRELARPEKEAVARHAAAAIPDRATLYLDVGTTVETCARVLAARPGFRIFTNSARAALAFDPAQHEVHVLGGRLAGRDGSLVGEDVVLRIGAVQLDMALIACSGIDENGRVMDFDVSKIAVKKAAIRASHAAFLLATRSKFGRSALDTVAQLDRFDRVFTEAG